MLRLLAVLSFLALPASATAAPIQAGELLVAHGHRILRVDRETGAFSTFSPPPGVLTANLLAAGTTTALVVDPDGSLFAMNAGRIVVIDPVTGLQRVLRERQRTCVGLICGFVESDLPLGVAPRGLAIEPDVFSFYGDRRRLFVGSDDQIVQVRRRQGEVEAGLASLDVASDGESPLVAYVSAQRLDLSDGDLQRATMDVFTPAVSTLWDSPAALSTRGIDHRYGVTVVAIQGSNCSPASAGVYYAMNPPQPLSEGGFLRCPEDVAIDPLLEGRIWVSDRGTSGVPGRVIRLDFDGLNWVQAVLTALPEDGETGPIAVSPVTFVPEPAAGGLALATLAALGALARTRQSL